MKRILFSLFAGALAITLSVFPSQTASAKGGSGNCGWTTFTEPCPVGSVRAKRTKCKTKWFGTSSCTFENCTGVDIDAGTNLSDASCDTAKK